MTWSDNLFRILGRRPGEFDGAYEAYLACVHPEERNERRRTLDELLASGTEQRSEDRIVRGDGEQRRVESVIRVVRDEVGRPVRVVGVCRDLGPA